MLVGNDVVDLHDPRSQPEAIHNRFDTRVFTPRERRILKASPCAHSLRWTLWAAKESAYKVAKKLDSAVRFLPRDFEVLVPGDPEGGHFAGRDAVVVHERGSFDVHWDRTDEWVGAVATVRNATVRNAMVGNAMVGNAMVRNAMVRTSASCAAPPRTNGAASTHRPVSTRTERLEASSTDPSRAVRELACAALGTRMDLAPGQVRIAADRGIPIALCGDRRLPVDLSLSHHGRFVACAWGECG